jgi:hypothetical protein
MLVFKQSITFLKRAVPLNPSLTFTDRLQKSEIVRVNDPILAANLKYVFFVAAEREKYVHQNMSLNS